MMRFGKKGGNAFGCGALIGALIGVTMFLAAFVVLWQNEGRSDLSKLADDTVAISAATIAPANEAKPVAAAGTLLATAPLADPEYLQPGRYLQLVRHVEMFAWVQKEDGTTTTTNGDDSSTTTNYLYAQEWVAEPADSDTFQRPAGHVNPPLSVPAATHTANGATLGAFTVDLVRLELPEATPLALSPANRAVDTQGDKNYIFVGEGRLENPQLGDMRLHFSAVRDGPTVTLFGLQSGNHLLPYERGDDSLYLAYEGDREAGIAYLHSSYTTLLWLFRVLGALLMWIGLLLITSPLTKVLTFIPLVGGLGKIAVAALALGIALVLSVITATVSAIFHNPIALIAILVLVGGAVWYGARRTTPETKVEVAAP